MKKIPKARYSADTLYQLIERRRFNRCGQHETQLRALAQVAAGYTWVHGIAACDEVVEKARMACHVEVQIRVGKSAYPAARQELIGRAAKLGWTHRPNHQEKLIKLVSGDGQRMYDGSIMPTEGELRVALFQISTDLLGENLTMVGRPLELGERRRLEQEAATRPAQLVRTVRWSGSRWEPIANAELATQQNAVATGAAESGDIGGSAENTADRQGGVSIGGTDIGRADSNEECDDGCNTADSANADSDTDSSADESTAAT